MLSPEKIERINVLARKKKSEALKKPKNKRLYVKNT